MKHPFELLRGGYELDLANMRVLRAKDIDAAANKLIKNVQEERYEEVSEETGIPQIWIAASFEREASSDFSKSPAQGDRWDHVSTHMPRGRGPFLSWNEAALDAYHLNGLDRVGENNWTWALACYYGELFNGFGYRDFRSMRSPYLWGGTNLQQHGKYVADGRFDSSVMDSQLGIIPIMMRMVQLDQKLNIGTTWPFQLTKNFATSIPLIKTPMADFDIFTIQQALQAHGFSPGKIDGSFGRKTSAALREFEAANGLVADGLLDPQTIAALGI